MSQTMTTTAPDSVVQRANSRVGAVLKDKWRLDALLGVGGMAAVYAATHRNKKRVAVKILHQEFSQQNEVKARFLREGYAANVIEHPGAVSVLDDDVIDDGAAFLVMELLEGETLEQRWERYAQRLPPRDVLVFADQLLDVLSAAHKKGIVHRDIKPDNLFVTHGGVLKVLDFGIARVFENQDSKQATRAGQIIGTPAFMAPEQALARWNEVDGRTDLWAVGATMFTLLSGKNVHEGKTGTEQLVYSATRPAPPLATVAPSVPATVAQVVDRALAFERENRWQSAEEMQAAVRSVVANLGASPISEQRIGAPAPGSVPRLPVAPTLAAPFEPGPESMRSDTSELRVPAAARAAEHEQRLRELAQAQPAVAELTARHGAAKQKVAEAHALLNAARGERASKEASFKQHASGRTSAADAARAQMNKSFADFGKAVLADTAFGSEFDAAREEIKRARARLAAAEKDVRLHEAARKSYDVRGVKTGYAVAAAVLLVGLILFFMPVILRFAAD